ncbi:MAG: type II secretion system F family protein [Anaerolineae bacterium]|nr:type II secretion system F family protein [Anaerolineae bacterium]
MAYIILGIVGIAIIVLVVLLFRKPAGQDLLEERLGDESPKPEEEKRTEQTSVVGAAIDRAVADKGFAQNLATQLARADLKVTVGEFLALSFILAVGLSLIFYVLNRYILILAAIALGFVGPRLYLNIRKGGRLKKFNDQLSDALNLIVNSLRAGYSTMQAMEVIAHEMPAPISEEFRRVTLELQLGVPFDTAMANLLRRMPSADMDLVVTAMSVQREVGGNLAEVLDSISFTIRERIRIKGEVRTMTSQGRISGYIVTGIPFALGAFIYTVNPNYVMPLVSEPCGWMMLGVSGLLIIIGYAVISKITNIEV